MKFTAISSDHWRKERADGMNILETRKLSYCYESGEKALTDIDVAIEAGKITAILGGNGAGKSTLFLNMNGVFTPTGGEVFLDGERVTFDAKGKNKLRRRVGIVFQDPNDQLFSASVRGDIAFGALNMGISAEKVRTEIKEVAEKTGITQFLDRPTHALSFGQKKRVAIAGILIMRPDVIILDEPTAGLDPRGVSEILKLLLQIKNDTGMAVVIATHEIDLVPLYCDYAYVLDGGVVALKGTPRDIFAAKEELRAHSLRTSRISHLMEILSDKDGIWLDKSAATVSQARASIKAFLLGNSTRAVVKNGKALRRGYTTGSCATAAATAAARILLSGEELTAVAIRLPNGERVVFPLSDVEKGADFVSCRVVKDAGDDPDVTDGIAIFARCSLTETAGVTLHGGAGVGVVTEKGLPCPVGTAAINPVPRREIIANVREVCEEEGYAGGLSVVISAPEGISIAEKTFNPRLGIVGGISILGTSGIVEPMSEAALVDTIKLLIDKHSAENGEEILLSPGNYGVNFCRESLHLDIEKAVKCSNFIGETLDYLVYKGFKRVLLVGHVGKLVKLGGGVMNTHSGMADCRMEIIAANAAICGGDSVLAGQILACPTTDGAIELLDEAGLSTAVFAKIMERIKFHLDYRVKGGAQIEVIMFTLTGKHGRIIASSEGAVRFLGLFMEG